MKLKTKLTGDTTTFTGGGESTLLSDGGPRRSYELTSIVLARWNEMTLEKVKIWIEFFLELGRRRIL